MDDFLYQQRLQSLIEEPLEKGLLTPIQRAGRAAANWLQKRAVKSELRDPKGEGRRRSPSGFRIDSKTLIPFDSRHKDRRITSLDTLYHEGDEHGDRVKRIASLIRLDPAIQMLGKVIQGRRRGITGDEAVGIANRSAFPDSTPAADDLGLNRAAAADYRMRLTPGEAEIVQKMEDDVKDLPKVVKEALEEQKKGKISSIEDPYVRMGTTNIVGAQSQLKSDLLAELSRTTDPTTGKPVRLPGKSAIGTLADTGMIRGRRERDRAKRKFSVGPWNFRFGGKEGVIGGYENPEDFIRTGTLQQLSFSRDRLAHLEANTKNRLKGELGDDPQPQAKIEEAADSIVDHLQGVSRTTTKQPFSKTPSSLRFPFIPDIFPSPVSRARSLLSNQYYKRHNIPRGSGLSENDRIRELSPQGRDKWAAGLRGLVESRKNPEKKPQRSSLDAITQERLYRKLILANRKR